MDIIQQLHQAISNEDFDKLKNEIEKENFNVNFRYKLNITLLHKASEKGNRKIVEYLISKGANIYAKVKEIDRIPLHYAAKSGNIEVVKLLLQKGGLQQLDARGGNKKTPLILAAAYGHLDIVRLLLKNGARIDAKTIKNETALHFAVMYGHFKVVELLFAEGIDINAKIDSGASPLHMGVYYGHIEIVQSFIRHKALIEAKDNDGNTPLHWAITYGPESIFVCLVSQGGAQLEPKNSCGETPLHLACREGHLEIVKHLLQKGVSIEAKTKKDEIPLHYGAQYGNLEIVKYLTEQRVTMINARNLNNKTPLDLADSDTDIEVRQYLKEMLNRYSNDNTNNNNTSISQFPDSDLELIETCSKASMKRKANNSSVPDEIEIVHESSKTKRLVTHDDQNDSEVNQKGKSNISQNLKIIELQQEIKNLKERLDEAISKRSQVNTHPNCGFSCQYCLQVPNGLSYSLNCGHLPFCNQCSQSILHNEILSKRICPICTEKVISRQKVFVNLMKCGNGKNANENDTNVVVLQ